MEYNLNFLVTIVFLIIISAIISYGISVKVNSRDDTGFKISDITEGVAVQICTASVNSPQLFCKADNTAVILYNISQERLIEVIKQCGIDSEIIQTTHCIGDYLEIRNLKEYYTN